jgi:hypothetical protein
MSTWDQLTAAQKERVLDKCDEVSERDMERAHDGMLDECTEPFMGTYPASEVLKAVDPIAYRCSLADYCGSEPYVELDGRYWTEDQVSAAIDEVCEEDDYAAEAAEARDDDGDGGDE